MIDVTLHTYNHRHQEGKSLTLDAERVEPEYRILGEIRIKIEGPDGKILAYITNNDARTLISSIEDALTPTDEEIAALYVDEQESAAVQ